MRSRTLLPMAACLGMGVALGACSLGSVASSSSAPAAAAPAAVTPLIAGAPAADPNVVQSIATACSDSGLFKLADGTVATLIPVATLPVDIINAGVDKVCANPAQFASDVSTAEWVVKNTIADAQKLLSARKQSAHLAELHAAWLRSRRA